MLGAEDELEGLTDKNKVKVVSQLGFFGPYILSDILKKDPVLCLLLWDKALENPRTLAALKQHVFKLRGNDKLPKKKKAKGNG